MLRHLPGVRHIADHQERKREQLQAHEDAKRLRLESANQRVTLAAIAKFPERRLSAAELERLPRGADLDLETCELDTWFVCEPLSYAPGVVVVGHVVPFERALAAQYGAGVLSAPARFVNRYRPVLV